MGNDPVNIVDPSGGIGIPCPGTAAIDIFFMKAGEMLSNGVSALTKLSPLFNMGINAAKIGIDFNSRGIQNRILNIQLVGNITQQVGGNGAALGSTDLTDNAVANTESNQYANWAGNKENKFSPFKTLLSNYSLPYDIRPDRTPINPSLPLNDNTDDPIQANFLYFNQCSIRMSLSLRRSGVSLAGALNISNPPPNGSRLAPTGNGNILGAKNLAGLLFKFGKPEIYNGTVTDVVSKLKNRTGIVYFENFVEDGRRSISATHIDLWDKTHYMSPYPFSQMFNATRIFFWDIK
jgi:hypothetical protein